MKRKSKQHFEIKLTKISHYHKLYGLLVCVCVCVCLSEGASLTRAASASLRNTGTVMRGPLQPYNSTTPFLFMIYFTSLKFSCHGVLDSH